VARSEKHRMTIPNQLSLEALTAEEGMYVSAGLPEGLRRDLEELKSSRSRAEQAQSKRERLEQLLASIAERQAEIVKLQEELRTVLDEYTTAITAPAA
jgi:hypothetical protein